MAQKTRPQAETLYGLPQPLQTGLLVPIIAKRDPTTADTGYALGQPWDNKTNNTYWVLTSVAGGSANWEDLTSSGTGSVATLTGNSGGALSPTAGNINILGSGVLAFAGAGSTLTGSITPGTALLATLTGDSGGAISPTAGNITTAGTANQITTTGSGSTITWSLPLAITAPGSLQTTTTLTAGTGLTVTTGNADVSAGNANVTGNVIASKSAAAANVTVQATNSDNTSGTSNAGVEIATGGASSGDPYLSFQISGVGASTMTMGLDNSSSDTFVISNSGTIGTSNALTLTQAGALGATTSITAGTTLTATLGNITATNGNLVMSTAGNKVVVPTGANASAGVSGVMSGTPGAVTVATTASSATALIFYSRATTGGTPGEVSITAQDGTGFTLTSTANETSTFNWWIINL